MTPRTVAEFAALGLKVCLSCRGCARVSTLPFDVLDATFGADFDLIVGQRQISSQLYCPACGASRPTVILETTTAVSTITLSRHRRATG